MDEIPDESTVERPASDVTVNSASQSQAFGRPYRGLSPLKAGLLYGGAASTVMGPLGLLVGLAAGVTAKRMQDNYLDQQAREARNMRGETNSVGEEIDGQMRYSDPDTQRLLQHAKLMNANGWMRLQAGDESGRELITNATNIVQGVMQGNVEQQRTELAAAHSMQRGLVTTAANDYRSQFQQNVEQATNLDQQAMRVLDLANQPGFDPNKPFNKAILADLLSYGVNGMYKDAPDMIDAIKEGSGAFSHIPIVGGAISDIAGGIATWVKSEDFKVTKEDYNRIALNMKAYNTKYTQQKMGQLGQQSDALGAFAQKQGMLPTDYTMRDYVSGNMKELNFLPAPQVPTIATKKPAAPINSVYSGPDYIHQQYRPPTLPGQFGQGDLWQDPNVVRFLQGHKAPSRPTN